MRVIIAPQNQILSKLKENDFHFKETSPNVITIIKKYKKYKNIPVISNNVFNKTTCITNNELNI